MTDIVERAVDPITGIGNWIPQDIIDEAEWLVKHLCLGEADNIKAIKSVLRVRLHARQETLPGAKFSRGDRVRKTRGSSWQGNVVGFYSTELTPIGYCVESEREPGSVQLYPEAALELVSGDEASNASDARDKALEPKNGEQL